MPTSLKTVLVVDDSDAEREIVALTVGAAFPNVDVRMAAHPAMAREMCADEGFDCVILDYNMPQTDGMTLAGELKANAAYLPIILMTSVGDEMLAAEALRSGISDYIPKSRITAESIRRMVERSVQVCSQAKLIDEQRGELENFAYALAHDFKQPIRQITTFTQMIAEEIAPDEQHVLHQHLNFLGEAARRLGRLVDVMSQYTLLNQPPELSDVDLADVVESVRASLGPYLAERAGELAASGKLPVVRGNETLMTQVVQNLVANGMLYNRSTPPRVEVSAHRRHDNWEIAITDNGVGIEPEYLADIFKPLIRLHTASEFPGTGLGLTLARKAIIAQNGRIWCESEIGRGSTFHIRLPAAGKSRSSRKEAASEKDRAEERPAL